MNGSQAKHWVRVARSFFADGFILVFAFMVGTLIRLGPEWAGDGYDFAQMLTLSVEEYWPGMLLGGLFFPSAVYVCGLYAPKSFHRGILPRFLLLCLCLLLTFWILAALFYLNFSTRIGRGVMLLSSDFATEAFGSLLGVLLYGGIAILVFITAILWLFFPVFCYFYLKRIAIATEASQHFLEALLMKKD